MAEDGSVAEEGRRISKNGEFRTKQVPKLRCCLWRGILEEIRRLLLTQRGLNAHARLRVPPSGRDAREAAGFVEGTPKTQSCSPEPP